MRWLSAGDSFTAGDRTLHVVGPPLFDSPTTRGLFDDCTGFYWAVDNFASVLPTPQVEAADVDRAKWIEGFAVNRINSPWHQWLDLAPPTVAFLGALGDRTATVVVDGTHGSVGSARSTADALPGVLTWDRCG